ncbi:aspartic peptidase domain-containing protein [Massariosphaeria phaeospora]|uniref:Aspartic peptidase domain-containing protein n=1 Tax=Massariosphaeria phaeospora TaxID=100035 RepID=A0A7C8I877_9PLEO|nr:aspartic peptidase domain-containing protein [Massariosphaeria phaeospora]
MTLAPRQSPSPSPYVVPPSKKFDGNDGSWSTFKISVGSPGQDFRVLASTKGGETYLVKSGGCLEGIDPEDCPNLRGAEIFNSAQNPGFQVNVSSSWSTIGQYGADLEDRLNYTSDAMFGFDKVSLGPAADSRALSLDHQVVAGVEDFDYFMGHIPLGVPDGSFSSLSQSIDSFLYQLRNGTMIPSLSFAYTAGAKYRLKSVFGSLILGGYDSTRFKPNQKDFSFSFSTDPSRLLTVGVESITATNTLKGTYSLSSDAHFSLVDSTVPHLWLPRDICDHFEEAFGLTYDPQTDFYIVNDTTHDELKSRNPSITIKLVNSLEDTTTNYTNIILPYAAFDLQASYPYYSNATNYFPIRRAANDTQYVLGRTLLQEAYLIVDYERTNFTISQAVFPDPLPAAKVITIEPPSESSSSSSSLSAAAIGGIAAGVSVLAIILIAAAVIFYRRRRQKRSYELANTQASDPTSSGGMAAAAHKVNYDPQELGSAALTELPSPYHDVDRKPVLSANNVPQELEVPGSTTPQWREVTNYYEMDGESVPSGDASRDVSRATSDNGRSSAGLGTGIVSPMTGRFHETGLR